MYVLAGLSHALYFIFSPVIATLGSVFKLRNSTISSSAFWKQLFIDPLKYFWVVFMTVLSSFCCLHIGYLFQKPWTFLPALQLLILLVPLISIILKLPGPIWNMWLTIYCHIEGSASLKDDLFSFGYTCYCSATHVMFCFCTVLFNLAQCCLALHTNVQDKSVYLNTKFKEEISSYVWINMEK